MALGFQIRRSYVLTLMDLFHSCARQLNKKSHSKQTLTKPCWSLMWTVRYLKCHPRMTADDRTWSDWLIAAGVSFACMHNDQRCNIIYITSMQTIQMPLKHIMYTCIKCHINLVHELFRNNLGHDDIYHRYILYTAEIRTKHIDFLSC